jgi:hypothetical protein
MSKMMRDPCRFGVAILTLGAAYFSPAMAEADTIQARDPGRAVDHSDQHRRHAPRDRGAAARADAATGLDDHYDIIRPGLRSAQQFPCLLRQQGFSSLLAPVAPLSTSEDARRGSRTCSAVRADSWRSSSQK